MTVLLSLLGKYWPYILILFAGVGIGGYGMHKADSIPLNALQAKYSQYVAQVATENANANMAYADGLAKQLKDFQDTTAHNAQVMQGLRDENASTAADLDFARRLLNAARAQPAAQATTGKGAGGGSDPAGVPKDGADQSLVSVVGGAAGECREALQHLIGLQDEVIPQTQKVPL